MRPEFRGKIMVLMDTRGLEIGTGTFGVHNSEKEFREGQELKLTTDYGVKGNEYGRREAEEEPWRQRVRREAACEAVESVGGDAETLERRGGLRARAATQKRFAKPWVSERACYR
mmetsp:Transcript_146020/g.364095  ORF Transcript_146020/g.364095 Transcript_146020/m.364095 type:complete len:115 (-) Transcript_146020:347-691(-)